MRGGGGESEKEGRLKSEEEGTGCDVCGKWEVGSGKIMAVELIRENIENSIGKKKMNPVPFLEFSKAILHWHSMP